MTPRDVECYEIEHRKGNLHIDTSWNTLCECMQKRQDTIAKVSLSLSISRVWKLWMGHNPTELRKGIVYIHTVKIKWFVTNAATITDHDVSCAFVNNSIRPVRLTKRTNGSWGLLLWWSGCVAWIRNWLLWGSGWENKNNFSRFLVLNAYVLFSKAYWDKHAVDSDKTPVIAGLRRVFETWSSLNWDCGKVFWDFFI